MAVNLQGLDSAESFDSDLVSADHFMVAEIFCDTADTVAAHLAL